MSGPPVDHPHWDPARGPWSSKREWVHDVTWDIPPVWDIPAALAASALLLVWSIKLTDPQDHYVAEEKHPWLHTWATKGTKGLLGMTEPHPRPREGEPEVIECMTCDRGFTTTHLETTHAHVCPRCARKEWPMDAMAKSYV